MTIDIAAVGRRMRQVLWGTPPLPEALAKRLAPPGMPVDTEAAMRAIQFPVAGQNAATVPLPWRAVRMSVLILKTTTLRERASAWAAWWRGTLDVRDRLWRWNEADLPIGCWPRPLRARGDVVRVLLRKYVRPIERPSLLLAAPLDIPPPAFYAAMMTFTNLLVVQTKDGVTRMIHSTECDQLDLI